MALSDTCFEALDNLQTDFVGYLDWDYPAEKLSNIIDAMYLLGEFMVDQDMHPGAPENYKKHHLDGVVIGALLDKAFQAEADEIIDVVAQVSEVNSKLNRSIEDMISNLLLNKNELKDEGNRLLDQLQSIKAIKSISD